MAITLFLSLLSKILPSSTSLLHTDTTFFRQMMALKKFFPFLLNAMMMMMMMMMMMLMNCFCGMVHQQKAFSLISSQEHCQRSSPSWISDMPQAGFEPAQNLKAGLVEWSCAVVITQQITTKTSFIVQSMLS